ncbi:hypothetical protein [Rhodoferax sp.]|uniref:hypothetical protein n=1 Tax=Rhodoferax sp. TaxID=50421 RepID=UPI0025EA3EDD|nr:hypothetical protein [Rhodoferax sp.]MCM2294873.1 hypothetical protein [Rhodoferax sp.]
MTPQDFIAKWGPGGSGFDLNERQGAQAHFIDLCQLLGVPTPGSAGDYMICLSGSDPKCLPRQGRYESRTEIVTASVARQSM